MLANSVDELVEDKKRRLSMENRYAYDAYEEEENRISNEDEAYLGRADQPARDALEKGYKIKVEILEQAIHDLQADRTDLVNIIKGK